MKKILLATTAIIALTAVASNANTFASDSTSSNVGVNLTHKVEGKRPIRKTNNGTGIILGSGSLIIHTDETHGEHQEMMTDAMKKAFENNDYNAFVTEFNVQLAKITVPTKEEFAKMVANYKNRPSDDQFAPLQAAIQSNNYDTFVAAFKTLKPSSITDSVIPTKEEFAKMVGMLQQHNAVEAAIKANDYDAFVKAFNANKPVVPTKEEFAKMVTLQQTIKTNKVEIKEIRDEKKNGTLTKSEAKDQIETIKSENSATKKANRLLTKPVRKINKLSNR